MRYNGKEVWTQETFDYSKVQVGDYVEQAVVDDAMDCLPPACMSANCSQMGEPYSHREDPETGKWRATYATFKKVAGKWPDCIWEYCGHCFCGKNVELAKTSSTAEGGDTMTLMERLLAAGYPRDQMFHHESDLYVFDMVLTREVIKKWCEDKGYNMNIFCKKFNDQQTRRPMFDIAFAYDPYWM